MKSCIYEGHIRHRRFTPVENAFRYSLFMMYLDLSELPRVFKGRWFWSAERFALARFQRKNYWGNPAIPLDQAIRDAVQAKTGTRPQGPIRMLTHLSYFGYCYNPVSFYFCYDISDARVETIAADINNTPWNERHLYILDEAMNESGKDGKKRYRFKKDFHISPFMAMDVNYDWYFEEPGQSLMIHMNNLKNNETIFDSTMTLSRREISGLALADVLAFYPLMTVKVLAAIYWQSLKLWIKKCTFYTHPAKLEQPAGGTSS